MKLLSLTLICFLMKVEVSFSSEAIGYYSSGELKDSQSILERNIPIHKLFIQRKRFFGTQEILDVMGDLADFIRHTYPDSEKLQIGDIANEKGGFCKEHGSHQNGLDADLVYLTKNKKLQSPDALYWEENFVNKKNITKNFSVEKNFYLFKYLITNHPVERIFVDFAIKKALCLYAKKNNLMNEKEVIETLRRLRVADLHQTHFHMRIACPTNDFTCKSQEPVPEGTGCF